MFVSFLYCKPVILTPFHIDFLEGTDYAQFTLRV